MTSNQHKSELYRAGSLEAAHIIAADPSRYPGVMQEWAALVLVRGGGAHRTGPEGSMNETYKLGCHALRPHSNPTAARWGAGLSPVRRSAIHPTERGTVAGRAA